jgi:hypothetical protein
MTPGMLKPPWRFDVFVNAVYLGRCMGASSEDAHRSWGGISFKGEFIQINATTLEHRASAQDVSRLAIDNRIESVQYTCHYHPCFGICVGQLGAPGCTFVWPKS